MRGKYKKLSHNNFSVYWIIMVFNVYPTATSVITVQFLKWGWRCRNTHRQHHLQHHHLEAGSVLSSASEKIQVLSHTCDLEFSGCRAQKSFIFNGTSVQHLESSGMKRLCWCDPCFWRWWANGSSQNSFGLVKSLDFKKPYRITHKLIFTWKVRFAWILGY